ncbi:hypothetical protein PM022_06945 [Halorubrum ezzemoulense]|uniref:hypothetical protein n=1 Tax=Halorubrum ezzemoulense TaxID=337243 RepID=UPI00232E8F52|nr:hypothetical protein [Halorubrum ezzemoulense]MDB2274286.1 hypothetical protein [Halorubrum ezzemoulense]
MIAGPTAVVAAGGHRTGRRRRTDRRSRTDCDDRRDRGSTDDPRSRTRLREGTNK